MNWCTLECPSTTSAFVYGENKTKKRSNSKRRHDTPFPWIEKRWVVRLPPAPHVVFPHRYKHKYINIYKNRTRRHFLSLENERVIQRRRYPTNQKSFPRYHSSMGFIGSWCLCPTPSAAVRFVSVYLESSRKFVSIRVYCQANLPYETRPWSLFTVMRASEPR